MVEYAGSTRESFARNQFSFPGLALSACLSTEDRRSLISSKSLRNRVKNNHVLF